MTNHQVTGIKKKKKRKTGRHSKPEWGSIYHPMSCHIFLNHDYFDTIYKRAKCTSPYFVLIKKKRRSLQLRQDFIA